MAGKDLTALRQELDKRTKQIDKMRRDFDKISRVKDELISVVSHELRTPLSIIKEGINLTLDEVAGKITPKQKQFLTISKQNIDRLSNLINDLLDISKIEAKKVVLRKSLVDLSAFTKNAVFPFLGLAREKQISIKQDLPEKEISVFFDPDKITQVINNFLSNALKFTKPGGKIAVSARETANNIQVSVSDTGIGIAKHNMCKLFNKFSQIGRTYGPGEKGTGLGLAISKGLIELHGGRIWAESNPGKSSVFSFTIPRASYEEVFREYVKNGIKESQEKREPFSILVSRIDNFEALKKKYGVLKPYEFLQDMAHAIKSRLRRATDVMIRNSGECAVLLPETDKNGASAVERRVRDSIAKALIAKKMDKEVQVSFGTSVYSEDGADNIEMIAKARAVFEGLYFGSDRRKSERKYARLRIEFIGEDKRNKQGSKENTQSINISRGGICLFSNINVPCGVLLKVTMRLPRDQETVNATAKVVWVKKVSRITGFQYKMGLIYEKIDHEDLAGLLRFVSGGV